MPSFEQIWSLLKDWLAYLLLGGAVSYKLRDAFRRGNREDAAGESEQAGYRRIIAEQTAHTRRLEDRIERQDVRISALDEKVKEQAIRITDEINRRYIAENVATRLESEAGGMRTRITAMQAIIDDLNARITEMELVRNGLP